MATSSETSAAAGTAGAAHQPTASSEAGGDPASGRSPLDDVMIAMDVVDTLRHDAFVVERELNEDERRAKLIERLREIYRGQGIDVPDRILAEGVQALEDDRFVYKPPADSFATRLARLYVTRSTWGRYVFGALAAIAILWIGWFIIYEWPRQSRLTAERTELTETLPNRLKSLQEQIDAATSQSQFKSSVPATVRRGLAAAQTGDLEAARAARTELEERLAKLDAAYTVRIVSRKGELSGLWRTPKVNKSARNYYLVVEAIDKDGKVLQQTILNEETGKRETVSKWAVRVPREVLERVRADKADDGIISEAEVALKQRGMLEPDWRIPLAGGAITSW